MVNFKIIGHKIADARKQLNISQAQLAERLFISSQAVGKWERGESMPDIVTFNRLADILRVDLNYFSEAATAIAPAREAAAEQPKQAGWDMSAGNWVDADFSGLGNLHEKFSGSNMQRSRFRDADLSGLALEGNHVVDCDFSGARINGSHFRQCHLAGNQFSHCSLRETAFTRSHLKDCDLSGADLSGAMFTSSSLQKNNLAGAALQGTAFNATDFTDVTFSGTIDNCTFDNCAFSRVTFQQARLTHTFFKCRRLKHIRFIDCEADRITLEFLKNGKADVSGITFITA